MALCSLKCRLVFLSTWCNMVVIFIYLQRTSKEVMLFYLNMIRLWKGVFHESIFLEWEQYLIFYSRVKFFRVTSRSNSIMEYFSGVRVIDTCSCHFVVQKKRHSPFSPFIPTSRQFPHPSLLNMGTFKCCELHPFFSFLLGFLSQPFPIHPL